MVKLVSFSTPSLELTEQGVEEIEDLIAYCARVSNPSNQLNNATVGKLLEYLIAHKHWSPFEMVSICVEINTTRDISRQILRHRSFTFQEFSQRYADVKFLDHISKECRLQDTENRQNSLPCHDENLVVWWQMAQETAWQTCEDLYHQALRRGIAKEVARSLLPEGMTPSKLYMMGTLRSWIHYLEIRTSRETQKEHRDIANDILELIADQCPTIFERIKENGT